MVEIEENGSQKCLKTLGCRDLGSGEHAWFNSFSGDEGSL